MKFKILQVTRREIENPIFQRLAEMFPVEKRDFERRDARRSWRREAERRLVVIGAREYGADELFDRESIFQRAARAGYPLLLFDVGAEHKAALATVVGAIGADDSVAVYVRRHRGPRVAKRFCVHEAVNLDAEAVPVAVETATRQAEIPLEREVAGNEDPSKSAEEMTREPWSVENCGPFLRAIFDEMREEKGGDPPPPPPPTGLKSFQTPETLHFNPINVNREPAYLTLTNVYQGYLDETPNSKSQYLMVTTEASGDPGALDDYHDHARGWFNASFQLGVAPEPSQPLDYWANIPTQSASSVSVDINYKTGSGGYSIYPYSATVSGSWASWTVANATSGDTSSELFYMDSPYDGSNVINTWKRALNTWGQISPLPDLSIHPFDFKSLNVFHTNQTYSGQVSLDFSCDWQFNRLRTKITGTGIKEYIYYTTYPFWQSVLIDFSPIAPNQARGSK